MPYPRQVLELEKIARIEGTEPRAPLEPAPLVEPGVGQDMACVVCDRAPARCCSVCRSVAYCSEQHRDVDSVWHHTVCQALREVAEDAAALRRYCRQDLAGAWLDRGGRLARPMVPVDWDEYFGGESRDLTEQRLLSDLGSRPLTLARLLDDLKLARQPRVEGTLRIHVMAASEKELEALPLYAEWAAFWPQLSFELAFVGPELPRAARPLHGAPRVGLSLLTAEYRRALWPQLGVPDLIVGFDAGLLLYRSWQATLLDLIQSGVPFAVTSYRGWEAEAEARLLSASGARCLKPPAPNPFASRAARRSATLVNDVSRDNSYVSVWC